MHVPINLCIRHFICILLIYIISMTSSVPSSISILSPVVVEHIITCRCGTKAMGLQFSFCLLFNVHYPYQYYILFQYIRSQAVVIFLCFVIMCTPLASSSTSCPRKGSSGMILPVMIIIQYYGYLARAGGIGKCRIGGWNILVLPNNNNNSVTTLLIYFNKSKRIVCASLLPQEMKHTH